MAQIKIGFGIGRCAMATLIRSKAVLFLALLDFLLLRTAAVRVLVVRGNSDSRSVEESSDSLGSEDSEEIDFLVDLIKSEVKERAPPPVTTVKIIKRKPDPVLATQHSIRHQKLESNPKGIKEYHVHYHSHQHKEPPKPPYMALTEGSFKPLLWESQLPLGNYETLKQFQRDPPLPYSESARVKSFKDYEAFLKSNLRPSDYRGYSSLKAPSEKPNREIRIQAVKDFETIIKPKFNFYKTKDSTPFERLRNYQDFMDSEEDKGVFLNKDRFAGFKDFSEIESPPEPKKPPEEKKAPEPVQEKGVKVRDFAIVIKSKPRPPPPNNENMQVKNFYKPRKPQHSSPKIPPFVNKLRIPNDRYFGRPRVLEAPGGAPKYIDRINSLKYPSTILMNMPYRQNLYSNALDYENRFFKMGLWPQESATNLRVRNTPTQLFIRRRS